MAYIKKVGILFLFGVLLIMSFSALTTQGNAVSTDCTGQSSTYSHTFSESGGTLSVYFEWSWNGNTCQVVGYNISQSASATSPYYISAGPAHSVTRDGYNYYVTYTVTFTAHANVEGYHYIHSAVSISITASAGGVLTLNSNTDTISLS